MAPGGACFVLDGLGATSLARLPSSGSLRLACRWHRWLDGFRQRSAVQQAGDDLELVRWTSLSRRMAKSISSLQYSRTSSSWWCDWRSLAL